MKTNLKGLIHRVVELERKRGMNSLMSNSEQFHLYLRANYRHSDGERLEAYTLLDRAVADGRILEGEWLHQSLKEMIKRRLRHRDFDELSEEQRETIRNTRLRKLLKVLFGPRDERDLRGQV